VRPGDSDPALGLGRGPEPPSSAPLRCGEGKGQPEGCGGEWLHAQENTGAGGQSGRAGRAWVAWLRSHADEEKAWLGKDRQSSEADGIRRARWVDGGGRGGDGRQGGAHRRELLLAKALPHTWEGDTPSEPAPPPLLPSLFSAPLLLPNSAASPLPPQLALLLAADGYLESFMAFLN
jgi:hypothetical protein